MSYAKDGITYIYCPECGGEGQTMIAKLYPSGHTECWVPCELCDGEGDFEEADYLVMKLAGEV